MGSTSSTPSGAPRSTPRSWSSPARTPSRPPWRPCAAAALQHRNIGQVFDRGEQEGGTAFVGMEYFEARSLEALLLEIGRLPPGRAVAIAYQVADALELTHRHGIVHRDVKPSNVIV